MEPNSEGLDGPISQALTKTTTEHSKPLRKHDPNKIACIDEQRDWYLINEDLRKFLLPIIKGEQRWPLYLFGEPGTGKTSAALVMLDYFGRPVGEAKTTPVIRDWWAGFVRVRDLTVLIEVDQGKHTWRNEGDSGTVTVNSLLKIVADAPLVVFDEIGVGAVSDWYLRKFLELLDMRCGNPSKPTIITGNILPTEIPKLYDGRVADRILRGKRFEMTGKSKRRA